MARRTKKDTLKRKTGGRQYRNICWVSTEGQTEMDYLSMDVFKESSLVVKFPPNRHPGQNHPIAVLNRLKQKLKSNDFRKGDEAWVVVDIDEWDKDEFSELLEWSASDSRYHMAISNPKFELFLVMHYDSGSGCTTSQKVDASLRNHWPQYKKRIDPNRFSSVEVRSAITYARAKRASCKSLIPDPGMTDMHLLIERLI